jgi:gamma-glutamyl hydrolase
LIHYTGAWAAVVKPDLEDGELYNLLDSLNGVLMPGGGLELFGKSQVGEPIPYYKTSKKIFEYAIKRTDEGGYFPIFGICQGLEVLHEIMNNDNEPDTFTRVKIYNQSRRLNFVYPDINSRWYAGFPAALVKEMASEELSYHAHDNTISTDLYNRNQKLREFMKITATDTFVD